MWLAEPTPPPALVLQGLSGTRDAMSRVPRLVCDLKAAPRDLQGVRNCLLCERKYVQEIFHLKLYFKKGNKTVFLLVVDMERSNTLLQGAEAISINR